MNRRRFPQLEARLLADTFAASVSVCTPAAASPFTGMARAIDGDSLMVGEREVRLFGVDASRTAI